MRKSTWLAALATTIALTIATPASAAVGVQLNGQPLTFDVPPVVESGRTLVPVRAIFEALGARITWDPATQTVSAVHPERNKYVILVLGSTTAWVDGVQITLDVPPKSIDGRTMVPLRFISTAMGADVQWDAATETAIITQAPLTTSDARALSRYTREIAYTHLEETMLCTRGTQGRLDDVTYLFSNDDPAFFADSAEYLQESIACWNSYEENYLAGLTPPAGAEAAHAELQTWVDLHQKTLLQIEQAMQAQTKGALAERDRLYKEAKQTFDATTPQEERMLAALNAITSTETEFLTVAEHQYVAWFDDYMGATDNCFSQLHMIGTGYMELSDATFAQGAADWWKELPETLKEQAPPTARMQALQQGALAELAKHTAAFEALAAKFQAGPVSPAEYEAQISLIETAWIEGSIPTLEHLFVYRDYGLE